jgi:hypothetical protein
MNIFYLDRDPYEAARLQCMPDECKRDDAVLGYRVYYKHKADEWAARGMSMKWKGKEEEWKTKLKNC